MTKLEKIIYDAIASGYSKEITEFTKEQITKDSERIAAAVLPLIEKGVFDLADSIIREKDETINKLKDRLEKAWQREDIKPKELDLIMQLSAKDKEIEQLRAALKDSLILGAIKPK